MDFFEVVNNRRSVRKFTNAEVPEDVIRKCLKASLQAPNSSNLQPWEFYWIRSAEKKKKVVKACFSQNMSFFPLDLRIILFIAVWQEVWAIISLVVICFSPQTQ